MNSILFRHVPDIRSFFYIGIRSNTRAGYSVVIFPATGYTSNQFDILNSSPRYEEQVRNIQKKMQSMEGQFDSCTEQLFEVDVLTDRDGAV